MKITKRSLRVTLALIFAVTFGIAFMAYAAAAAARDYSGLIELIKKEDRQAPLYNFNQFEEQFDEDYHKASLEYINNHPDLVKEIRQDLAGKPVRWKLDSFSQRLRFVPENRKNYAALFEDYCLDVIGYMLGKMKLDNPYSQIVTLTRARPQIPKDGMTAFVVHNLAKDYIASYTFYGQNRKNRKEIKLKLSGQHFLGEVGSYMTSIAVRSDSTFQFIPQHYTIWQNSAKNPYTALMTPLEETLHIVLRKHTQRAIKKHLIENSIDDIDAIDRIVKEWVAVEEAAVGGLVNSIFPRILKTYLKRLPHGLMDDDVEAKSGFKKYRYLRKGIEVIRRLGYQKALRIYRGDAAEFKKLLI